MSGPRRVNPAPRQPLPERLPAPREVTIVGGGLAGLAAATVLAERGASVTVIEREAFLGGRAGSWGDRLADGTDFQMERGFHAFFRHYYNLRALLRRIDPELGMLTPLEDYPILGPEGLQQSFSGLPRSPLLGLLTLVLRTPHLRLRDALKVDDDLGRSLLAYDPAATHDAFDAWTAADFLDRLGLPRAARQMLFDVFAHSFFNPESEYSAAELIAMMHFYFLGNPEGLIFDVVRGPFGPWIFDPLRARLEALGVRFILGRGARSIDRAGERFIVDLGGGDRHPSDDLILALPVPALRAVASASPALGPALRAQIDRQQVTLPFAVWRLWLDRPTAPGRAPFVGTTGLGLLDNISLYHLFEDESRAWARAHGGAVVELHAYAVPEDRDEPAIKADLLEHLHALYPETRAAAIVDERFLLRRDCPAFPPGEGRHRLTVETPLRGLFLAGDLVNTSFPSALMERAVATGFLAANAILGSNGCAEEPIWSVRPRGLLARWRRPPRNVSRSTNEATRRPSRRDLTSP